MKKSYKIMGTLLLLAVFLFIANWVFNHINPWMGCAIYGVIISIIIIKLIDKYEEDIFG